MTGSDRTLGVVSIGQTPRPDILPELRALLPPCRIVEHGALDGLDRAGIAALAPRPGEEALATRAADGSPVIFAHRHADELLAGAIRRAEDDGAELVLLACGSAFPTLAHRVPLYRTERLAQQAVRALAADHRLGVVRPVAGQLDAACRAWDRVLGRAAVTARASVNPFTAERDRIDRVAAELATACDLIILDCFGYDEPMRRAATKAAGKPVLLIRGLAARLLGELLAG